MKTLKYRVSLEFRADICRPPKRAVCVQMHLGPSYRKHMCPSQETLSEDKIMTHWGSLDSSKIKTHWRPLYSLYFPGDVLLFQSCIWGIL